MSYLPKFVASFVVMFLMAVVASRQLFIFAVIRDQNGAGGLPETYYHLWFAIVASVVACAAGALMFYVYLRHGQNSGSSRMIPVTVPTFAGVDPISPANATTGANIDTILPSLARSWTTEYQASDRRPMDGSVVRGNGTPSANRASARQSHQAKFKSWSQSRHD